MSTAQSDLFDQDTLAELADQSGTATTQWRLESLQVINWGGFEGHHHLPLHPDATLLSGGSGTGKSTLLDAYTALMMPFTVAFNGASNDSGVGRARDESGGQRTLLTYLRGKQGVNDESGGASSDNLLRGRGKATWGAVAGTFVDTAGSSFSALRLYFVPAAATDVSGISVRMATLPTRVDLRDLEKAMVRHTAGKPLANVLTSTWPAAVVHSKYADFSNTLFTKLGIGANGDGAKALDLLARIQAGRSVNSVNALYRDLVLDEPSTFRNANLALGHFDTLADDLAKMIDAERKHATLHDIREIHTRLTDARTRLESLDQYGLKATGPTKLTGWSLRTEQRLLETAENLAKDRHRAAAEAQRTAKSDVDRLWADLETARRDYRASGGEELAGLAEMLKSLAGDLTMSTAARERLLGHVAAVEATLNSRGDFDTLQDDARSFAANRDTWTADYNRRRDALRDRQRPLAERRDQLKRDLTQLRKSGTRIRSNMAQMRDLVAERLGMRPADLPFLAELIDIHPGEERWRTAIETVLGGDASRIVLPAGRRKENSRLLDSLSVGRKIRFIDGTTDVALRYPLDGATSADQTDRILGKLAFADTPYAGWVQEHLSGHGLNALCVERPEDLDGPGFRVTANGQTRTGIRSQVGRSSDNIIGFSAEAEIRRIEDELDGLEAQLATGMRELAAIEAESSRRGAQQDAYAAILGFRWDDVDVDALTARIETLESRREQLLSADDKLARLTEQIETLEGLHHDALLEHASREATTRDLDKAWGRLADRRDWVSDQLEPYEDSPAFALTEDQQADLDSVYAAAVADAEGQDAIVEADRLPERMGAMHRTLTGAVTAAERQVEDAEKALTRTFTAFQASWPEVNLGTTPDSYRDYLRILQELEAKGLHETREDWQQTVAEWSGQDLMPLHQSLTSEIDAIKDRIAPINDILRTLPFGARRGRLRLKVDDIHSESVRQFRRRLGRMTQLATGNLSFEDTRKIFGELEAFMDQMREPRDPRYNPERSDRVRLLDVRRHVEVYAVEYPVDGATWPDRTHKQLGSASGGESQELIAFIIGSALRFRLGDELLARPRFAPVFLDEGFVKADSEFAGRAVSAWRGLKFQIIVGTPEDKFTGLERHMDSFVVFYKDPATGYSYLDHVADHDAAVAARGAGTAAVDASSGAGSGVGEADQ